MRRCPIKPLLAHVYEPHRVTFPCYVQPKLNGIRALYQTIGKKGYFQSRDGLPFTDGLLDHLTKPLAQVFGPEVILDGELYVHGWPLQRILGAITPIRNAPVEDTLKVEYHVFDVVDFTKSFEDRFWWADVSKELCDAGLNFVTTGKIVGQGGTREHQESLADNAYAKFVNQGYEGMVYRLGSCPYTKPKQQDYAASQGGRPSRIKFLSDKDNRCWHLLKRKNWLDDEFLFLSLEPTVGEKGQPGFQMMLKSKSKTIPTFHVSSGLTQAEVEHYLANPPVGRLVKVKYLVLSQDEIPQNATILAIL